MAEYIEREAVMKIIGNYGCDKGGTLGRHSGIADIIEGEINRIPAADVVPVKHGHIVWKDRCRGGFKTAKCLNCTKGSVFCNHTAKYDNRHRCRDPYCSECGKLMGTFNNYCGNCGAKMDGGDDNNAS